MRRILCTTVLIPAVLVLAAQPAQAAVGVEKVSRSSGSAGDRVTLTIGCGFCYPPCEGKPARNTPCMLGTRRRPPDAFPVSLVPIEKTPRPHPCGPRLICSPQVQRPPRRDPFSYLGEAVPPGNIEAIRESGRNYVPRYTLEFEIPAVGPGMYVFVIFCDVCQDGGAGSLIAEPRVRPWRIRVERGVYR